MKTRPEFPELLPPEAPHVQRRKVPGWWLPLGIGLGLVCWVVLILLLI